VTKCGQGAPVELPSLAPGTLRITIFARTLGTAGYMSPNQASGIDKRADIWVFGLAVV